MERLTLLRRLAEQQQFAALREAAAGSPDMPTQVLLALALAHLGEHEAASAWIASVDPSALDIPARVDLAGVLLALGRVDDAATLLEATLALALAREDDPSLALARLAACRLQQDRRDEALALFERSAAARPRVPVLLNAARLLLEAGRTPQCQRTIDAARTLHGALPDDWPQALRDHYRFQLDALQLEAWMAAGRDDAAEAWLEAAHPTMTRDAWCALLLSHVRSLAARDRHAQAEELMRTALRRDKDQPALYEPLADLAFVQGRPLHAAALLRQAIRLAERDGRETLPLWARLSATIGQQDPAAARKAAERACQRAAALPLETVRPADDKAQWRMLAELAMARVEILEARHDAAEARYRAVLRDHPRHASALADYGQLLLQVGRLDEAVALFEQVRDQDPARGLAALITARRFPDDVATLEHLEALARTPGIEGSVRAGLLLQLAAAWEKRKDHVRAFALVDEGNAATRRHLPYDPVAHRQRCARIRHAFSRSLFEHRRDVGVPDTLPVFVLGMPRSGTTLVEQIIAGHSEVHGAGELGQIPQTIAGLERWERRVGSGRHYPDCVDDISPQVAAGIADNLLKELREHAPDARYIVDKLPHNFENIGLIKLLFPRAKIISVRRDPRDIAISNYFTDFAAKHGGMGFAYDLGWIGEQLADHHRLMHHWHQLFPGEILEVRYEDVVADVETQARRMLDYLELAWEPQVLRFNELERPVRTASVWQVRQPIYTTSKAKWEHYRAHLAPLTRATNAPIVTQPITDMVALPRPGLLEDGVAAFDADRLDDAETRFQQLLHHLPQHAAATFMLGLVWLRKGHLPDAIARMEQALERCPWNANWRRDFVRACALAGEPERAARFTTDKAAAAEREAVMDTEA
ncbi:MAG: tetratricopeptide repeat protein [Comamonadaceae bacterium]|nr:MAG: tetratricopeptide repeat protein [Comamonadaceae bacterium]